jgi:hypothetical protein
MRAQPFDEVTDFDISPHPGREARESFFGRWFMRVVAHVAVDPRGVRPIRLDGDDVEPVLLDQAPRNRGAGPVELRRAMSRLAEEEELRIRKTIEKLAEILRPVRRRQGLAKGANDRSSLIGALGAKSFG